MIEQLSIRPCPQLNTHILCHFLWMPTFPIKSIHFIQCKHQQFTISNLRSALEESSKQRPNIASQPTTTVGSAQSVSSITVKSPVIHGDATYSIGVSSAPSATTVTASGNTNANTNPTAINTSTHAASSLWNWWRNVHEV